jgi:tetratricopeptide (TPR) repeat protein
MRLETYVDETFCERARCEETLREAIRSQRDDLETLRETLRTDPSELERTRLGRTLNRLSTYLRLTDECDRACEYCDEAIEIWRDLGRERATFLARLRRAALDIRREAFAEAERRLDELVEEAADEPFAIYRDFALEFRGRLHARRGRREQAVEDFERALELRRNDGRDRLVQQTEHMLELARRDL